MSNGGLCLFSLSICSVTLLKVRLDLYLRSPCLVAKGLCCINYAQHFGRLYILVFTAFSKENEKEKSDLNHGTQKISIVPPS